MNYSDKIILKTGHILFSVLLVYSGLYALERCLYADCSFFLFKLINFKSFNFELGRYSSFIFQFPVLLAVKWNLPMTVVLISMSVSIQAVFYSAFIVAGHVYKNIPVAAAILLSVILAVPSAFFNPVTESYFALVFGLLLYAHINFIFQNPIGSFSLKFIGRFLIAAVFLLLVHFSHPNSVFILAFVFGAVFFIRKQFKAWWVYVLIIGYIGLYIFKISGINPDSYEADQLSVFSNLSVILLNFAEAHSLRFLNYHIINYLPHILGIIFLFVVFCRNKEYLECFFYFSVIFGFLIITSIVYYHGDSTPMMEKNYMLINLFVLLPVFEKLYFSGSLKVFQWLFVFLWFYAMVQITYDKQFYSKRIAEINKLINYSDNHNISKLLISDENCKANLAVSWSLTAESMMLSSIRGPEKTVAIYKENSDNPIDSSQFCVSKSILLTPFWQYFSIENLNKTYFNIDTLTVYSRKTIE